MRRGLPDTAPSWQEPAKREAIEVELRLITPMFGGGYKTREVDPFMPIRPAAIRGHLRFWWRATAGAQYKSAKELYQAEAAIWGAAATPDDKAVGKVAIRVEITHHGREAPYNDIVPKATPREGPLHGYFLFPFQKQGVSIPAATGKQEVAFRVRLLLQDTLTCEEKESVRNALKAWIAFGGVGARTRRGCGALTVVGSNPSEWLIPSERAPRQEWLDRLVPANLKGVKTVALPSLANAQVLLVSDASDATQVWRKLGRFWARFRKGHFTEEYQPMKKSKWNDYRGVLCKLSSTEETIRLAKPYLGLPIIYQQIPGARGLCFTGTLEPAESGRMASPVILKPVVLANGKIAGLIAVLNAQQPEQIEVNRRVYRLEPPSSQDPVLKSLGASTVMDAVIKAAKLHFSVHEDAIRVGGRA